MAVIGSSASSAQKDPVAEAVGVEIARRGWTLVCGGRGDAPYPGIPWIRAADAEQAVGEIERIRQKDAHRRP